jgi:hypothetical protein
MRECRAERSDFRRIRCHTRASSIRVGQPNRDRRERQSLHQPDLPLYPDLGCAMDAVNNAIHAWLGRPDTRQ